MVLTDALKAMAGKEFTDKLKNKWIVIISAAFGLFTIIIAYFGSSIAGVAGFRDMTATIASLTSLVIYFIPIMALTLGGGVVADESDKHTLDIFLAAPISITEFILGKFAGLSISLALPTVMGFGAAGVILVIKVGTSALFSYLIFIVNSIILGLIFLSISFFVSVMFYDRSRVIAFTVFVWLFYTILYDLGVVGLLVVTNGAVNINILSGLLMCNPIDVYRIMNFTSIGEYSMFLGLSSIDFPKYLNWPVLYGLSIVWIVVPLVLSLKYFKKRYQL